MEALKLTGIAKHGFLTVAVPHQFDERELEVIIISADEAAVSNISTQEQEQKNMVKRLLDVVGTAKEHGIANAGTETSEEVFKKFEDMTGEERVNELMKYWGTAKYPDMPTNKYDVYEQ